MKSLWRINFNAASVIHDAEIGIDSLCHIYYELSIQIMPACICGASCIHHRNCLLGNACMLTCSILLCLWEASDSMDPVEKYVGEITRKKGNDSTHLYYKLFMALSRLRDFFYCGEKGITKQQLDRNSMLVVVHVWRISSYIKHQ